MSDSNGGGSGCLKWLFIGLGVMVMSGLILFFSGYYVLFHTAWPVRKAVEAFTADTDVKIEGIEGSLSSGFSVEKIRFPDEDGNINEIDDIGFKYEQGDDTFIINDIHVARAHFYVDGFFDSILEDEGDDEIKITRSKNNFNNDYDSETLNLIVKNVDISDITIEDIKTGVKFHLEKIALDGFETIDDNLKLGSLVIKSKNVDIQVTPVDSSLELATEHVIKGIIKKGIHKALIKDIKLNGKCIAENKDSYKIDLELFGGKIKINSEEPNEIHSVDIDSFTPNEYISSIFCLKDINLKYSGKEGKGNAEVANFKIGSKLFEIDKTLFKDTKEKDLVAICKDGKTQYKCTIKNKDNSLPEVKLSSTPEMTPKDILSLLLFEMKYDKLKASQKKQVDEELKDAN